MRSKMSESRPITTPPRRRNNLLAHVQHVFNGGSAVGNGSSTIEPSSSPSQSKANGDGASTNGTIRKLESYHHALLESGCQSAKSSPLPHRRLDKLEGVIRDKPITPAISSMRRTFDCGSGGGGDDNSGTSSCEPSPAFLRKRLNSNGTAAGCVPANAMDHRFINNHQESPMPYRRPMQHHHPSANVADYKNAINKSQFRFDNGECKSMTQRQSSSSPPPPLPMRACYDSECCSPSLRPAFEHSSPSLRPVFIGEPGIFASPIRSVCNNRVSNCIDDINDEDTALQPHADQSIVSGWLKFRDNKRVSTAIFQTQFFSPSLPPSFAELFFSEMHLPRVCATHGLWIAVNQMDCTALNSIVN